MPSPMGRSSTRTTGRTSHDELVKKASWASSRRAAGSRSSDTSIPAACASSMTASRVIPGRLPAAGEGDPEARVVQRIGLEDLANKIRQAGLYLRQAQADAVRGLQQSLQVTITAEHDALDRAHRFEDSVPVKEASVEDGDARLFLGNEPSVQMNPHRAPPPRG